MSIFKLGLFLAALFASSPSSSLVNGQNVATVIRSDPNLANFSSFLDALGVSPGVGETIFAPSNDAFIKYGEDFTQLWKLYQEPLWFLHLREIILWHLVTEGRFMTDQIFDGQRVHMEVSKGNITINQQFSTLDGMPRNLIAEPNITASDGIVHIVDQVIIPPFMRLTIINQMLDDQSLKFAFSAMANIALYVGLDEEIDKIFDDGLTFLVPLNIRFFRAGIDVPDLLTEAKREYTRDFVLCHVIAENFYESTIFAIQKEAEVEQMLVKSWLGTDMWITTTENKVRFQSVGVVLADQLASNGYVPNLI
jgi:uncharacterized surface protein with fasciclin (FAS1) repeats